MRGEPYERDFVLIREPTEIPHPFRHVGKQLEGAGYKQLLEGLHRMPPCWTLHPGLPSLQNGEKEISVVYKPPSLLAFCYSSPDEQRHYFFFSH